MNNLHDERKILNYTYLLCIVCFLNLALLSKQFDSGALLVGAITCVLIGYSHFIIRRFYPDGDKYILVFAMILTVIGLVMLYRIDIVNGVLHSNDIANKLSKPHQITYYAIKQLVWFAIGVAGYIIIVVLFPDIKRFSKYKYFYLALTLIFMISASIFGTEINGSKNWIVFHGYMFQPSEFGKLFLVAYLSSALMDYEIFKDIMEPAFVVMISLALMVFQKDLGSALIIFGISITMVYIATSKFKYIITCFLLFIIGAFASYKIFDHVRVRVTIWRNPWPYATGKGYQIIQSLFSIASGGLFGTGLGLGHPEYVPVNSTDFIFAAICEELGIITGLAIIILYFLLFYRCMRAAVYVEDQFSRLIAVGYSAMVALQALVIMGGVINMVPLTGVTLPLVSYGGSSMLITFFSLAIIQKISEEGN